MTNQRDPAAQRFWTIQAVRILGAAFAVAGLYVLGRPDSGLPGWAGILLLLNGLIDMLIIPRLLVRRWRSPAE
jgi:hypothetical protein